MKKMIILIFLYFISGFFVTLHAQDVILLKSGEQLQVIVNEISNEVIKYKKFENPDGPIYIIEKNRVVMITYKNGTKDVFSESAVTEKPSIKSTQRMDVLEAKKGSVKQNGEYITDKEVKEILAINPDALKLYKSGQKQMGIGTIFGIGGLIFPITGAIVLNKTDNKPFAVVCVIGGVACLGTSMAITFSGRNKVKKAVDLYNDGLKDYSSQRFGIGFTNDGIALLFEF